MRRTAKSLGHALSGLVHAVQHGRNLRLFVVAHGLLMAAGALYGVDVFVLLLATFAACCFCLVELLNTALEHLADTVDDHEKRRQGGHYHLGIKHAKDTAAAAALVALFLYGVIVLWLMLVVFLAPQL